MTWYNIFVMSMKIIIIFLISLLLCSCNPKLEDNHLILINNNIDVYSDVYLYDLFENGSEMILNENKKISTLQVGLKTFKVKYKYDGKTYKKSYSINIVDKEAPRYLGGTNKTVVKDYDKDICNLLFFGDNYDGNVKCVIEGDYNLSEIGTYKLIYKLTDSSNNETKVNVTLNVIEKQDNTKPKQPTSKIQFSDVYNKYYNENTEVGIDVSKWQGEIDFEKVKNEGATFVMMRLGVQGSSKKELYVDQYFEQNYENAQKAGLKVGVYFYSIATNKNEAIEQANWVLDILNNRKLDLPIAFDWESWSKWNTFKISFYEINDIANSFLKQVEKQGYIGMLYSSKYYLENIWTNKFEYPIWLAHYTDNTNYKKDYLIWQKCNIGRIDGINGAVDIDILYK